MKINLTGKYGTIINFIKSLENLEYYSDIIDMQFNQSKPDSSQTANVGMFSLSGLNSPTTAKISNTDINLDASIDVVFYTKK
jgi:hypothetical protein